MLLQVKEGGAVVHVAPKAEVVRDRNPSYNLAREIGPYQGKEGFSLATHEGCGLGEGDPGGESCSGLDSDASDARRAAGSEVNPSQREVPAGRRKGD